MDIDSLFDTVALSQSRKQPDASEEVRTYRSLPFPDSKREDWKYSEVQRIDWKTLAPLDPAYAPFLQSNACTVSHSQTPTRPSWTPQDKIEAGVKACASRTMHVHVPQRVHASLHARHAPTQSAAHATIIDVSEGATLDYSEDYASDSLPRFFGCKTIFVLHENAVLNLSSLQRMGERTCMLSSKEFHLAQHAQARTVHVELGSLFSRLKIEQHFEGEGSQAAMHKAAFFGSGNQHFDITTNAFHHGKHTKSDILVKGALRDHASSVYRGLIGIDKTATGTDSFLADRVLHLSRGVRSNSIPSLKIDTNDVRASHGATISKLNEESLFYLSSRGLPRREAEKLVVQGFVNDVLSSVQDENIRAQSVQLVEYKTGA